MGALAIVYPNGQVKIRQVRSTAYPDADDVLDFNEWALHIRFTTDRFFRSNAAYETVLNTEVLLEEAQLIINNIKNTEQ